MIILQKLNKHIDQIKEGGISVFNKKLKSFFYLILQIPIYLISIPTVIIIRLIRPWFVIRLKQLYSNRLGHFATETEIYCCECDAGINVPSQRYIDLFYLQKFSANRQLEKMWRRNLIILPSWLLIPIVKANRFINIFVPGGNYHEIKEIGNFVVRDIPNVIERFQAHISFTNEEEVKGKRILKDMGIPENAKFVCLNVRDSGYLDRHEKSKLIRWSYHDYRDADIDKYVLAAEELVRRGYYVIRTGVNVLKPLKSPNPQIIDYANLEIRSDFMDVYLASKCIFCLAISSGFMDVAYIFRKPIVDTNSVPLGIVRYLGKKSLTITKHHMHKKYKNRLTISEIFSSNVGLSFRSEEFENNDIKLEENSSEEIRDLVIEMDDRLKGNWSETKEDLLLQGKFWSIYEEKIQSLKLRRPMHGKFKTKIGAKYLRENQDWIR